MRRTLAVAAMLAIALAAPTSALADSKDQNQLQAGLDDLRDLGITGTQGLVRDGNDVTRARSGVGDLRTGASMPADGYFRIGSTTKTFVSVVVLQLVGEGRLSLDDTVERWLPGVVSGNGNNGDAITVRQLLQQTSGIDNYIYDLAINSAEDFQQHRFDHYDNADLVALAMRHPPLFAPGTHWSYSNTNYTLAAMIIEKVTGRPWAAEVGSRIINPLRLRHTSYPGDQPYLPRPHATTYQQYTVDGPLVDTTAFNPTAAGPSGGMVSTTTDLARFWQALQRGQLLRPRQMADMHHTVLAETLQGLIPGLRYGLGIFWAPNRCGGYWAHPGDVPGVSTVNAVTTDGNRAVVLYMATQPADDGAALGRSLRLLDEVICGSG